MLTVPLGRADGGWVETQTESPEEVVGVAALPTLAAGSVLGSYRVVGLLAVGGMGQVYEAVHTVIDRRVALKVLHHEHASNSRSVERLFAEAQVVNRISHPGIVEVTDLFVDGGRPCIVMELLQGRTLSAEIERRQRLPVGLVVDIARQIAAALGAAHKHDVVHRDLKPENIVLLGDDAQPRVKVLDFGVAKLGESYNGNRRTSAGALVGTPEYMAPEQLAGVAVDHRADVYALGVCLYEMLSGARPFRGVFGDLVIKHMTVDPDPLDAPAPMAALVHRLLAKNPAHRPQSMDDVIALLDALPTSVATMRPATTTRPTVDVPTRRTPVTAVLAAAVVTAVVALVAVGIATRANVADAAPDSTATTTPSTPMTATLQLLPPPTTMAPTTTAPPPPETKALTSARKPLPSPKPSTPPSQKRAVVDPFAEGG